MRSLFFLKYRHLTVGILWFKSEKLQNKALKPYSIVAYKEVLNRKQEVILCKTSLVTSLYSTCFILNRECDEHEMSKLAKNDEMCKKLWDFTCEELGIIEDE